MKDNVRILGIVALMMLGFSLVMIVVMTINFTDFSRGKEIEKAKTIASLVQDGLTAHMVNGTMDKRNFFLDSVKESSGALKIWLFRTKEVEELYGKGLVNEVIKDDIDKKAITTRQIQIKIDEKLTTSTLRITIPYIATVTQNPNCLSCHTNAKEGDALGGISMVFNVDEARNKAILTILKTVGLSVVFIIFFIIITNRFLKPYTEVILLMRDALKKAVNGDYTVRIKESGSHEVYNVSKWFNTLLGKLDKTVSSIEKNISLFVADRQRSFRDPLEKSQFVIEDIADIYRFKKTIEQDISKDVIYDRLVKVFKEQLHVADLSLFEIDIKNDKRVIIYDDTPEKFCQEADNSPTMRCRAFRTNSVVISDEFPNICLSCETTKEYLCINYPIDENYSIVLNIKPENKEELHENKKAIGYIKNYLESARPVLQSKILTEILQRSNMIDGLTGLYNRKYLDIFMDNKVKKFSEFAIAMVDIDYFKKVNDGYGHDVGDKVLKELSEIFKKYIKEPNLAFRFGGEEFLLFIPDVSSAKDIVQTIKDDFEQKVFKVEGDSFSKTFSVGISFYKKDSEQIWQVIKNADVALYEAKNRGRNRIVLYEEVKSS